MMFIMQHTLPLYFNDPEKNAPLFPHSIEGMTPPASAYRSNAVANHAQPNDSTTRLSEIKAKTLYYCGQAGLDCPVMNAEHVHQSISGSELVEIENSGHFPWIEEPTAFFSAVATFLGSERK